MSNFFLENLELKKFFGFFRGSLIGVMIDFIGYQFLLSLGLSVFLSNIISSYMAITFTYLFVHHAVFENKNSTNGYILFISYYAISILFFSYILSVVCIELSLLPILSKLLTLPASFFINYIAVRLILKNV